MRKLKILIFFFSSSVLYVNGQQDECSCTSDSLIANNISCDTIIFSNYSKVYWQFNCDLIWLVFKNLNGDKLVINSLPAELHNYTYRIGYHLIKEYKNSLLFRSGCSATGPCEYTLIDKLSGKKLKEFSQLICIDTDADWENPRKYQYNFVVYFSNNSNHLVIYFINTKKTIKIPFNENFKSLIPEHQFKKMSLKNNILFINYENDKGTNKTIKINFLETK